MSIKHHHPAYLPAMLDYGVFAKELAAAQYAVGLLQGSQGKLANAMHLIGPLVAREAAVSSKIEGTQSSSDDVYMFDAGGKAAYSDTPVVSNYRTAMLDAISRLNPQTKKRLTSHIIKSLHGTLLRGVGHKGVLGDFRRDVVWIAEKEGDPIEKALYIPPEHVHVSTYVENILEYIDNDSDEINLVKAGVIHYQFEAVHPFDDGNGRIGRLLIPLILYCKGDLSLPIVYSSGYFEARPNDYREALRIVDSTGKFEIWLKFFLKAIAEQAKETMVLIDSIQNLHLKLKKKYEMSKSPYMSRFIDFLFESPIFTIPKMLEEISPKARLTAVRLVEQLIGDDILIEVIGDKGPGGSKLYAFPELLRIIR